ncbi:MAG: LysR family transcriptional regulator [Myxococcota bacterium]
MAKPIDVNDMLIFAQVAESAGFSAAARALGMPKSTISRRVAELEEALGVRLLQRTTRTLSLTDVGAAYAERCRALRAEVEEANLAVTSAGETPRGRLRVTAPIEIGRRYLAPVVAEFAVRYPEVEVEFELSDVARDLVAEGWDVAIRVGKLEDSSLIARRLGPTQQFVCAAPAYLEARGEPAHPGELRDHDTIVMTSGIGGIPWRFQAEDGPVTVEVEPRLVANDFQAVCELTLAGLGLARLPSWVAREYLESGRLRRVLPDHVPSEVSVFLVYPSRRNLSAKLRRFLELLDERLDPAPWLVSS